MSDHVSKSLCREGGWPPELADIVDKATRSRMMSGIRGKNTKPEIVVRKALHAAGYRFRLHRKDLPGKPDIVLPKYKTVIFVHGCFWHRHDCKYFKWPKTRPDFWRKKIEGNVKRDEKAFAELEKMGWDVKVLWECKIQAQLEADELSNELNFEIEAEDGRKRRRQTIRKTLGTK